MRNEQGHWVADGPDDLDDWQVVAVEPYKPGVMAYHVRRRFDDGSAEVRRVYVGVQGYQPLRLDCLIDTRALHPEDVFDKEQLRNWALSTFLVDELFDTEYLEAWARENGWRRD